MALIDITEAEGRIRAALAQHLPDTPCALLPLNDGGRAQAGFVLRVTPATGGSLIAKVTGDPAALTAQARRLAATHPRMKSGPLRVPEPLFHAPALGVLLMEDGWGQRAETLWRQGGAPALRAMGAAGRWLHRFHVLSLRAAVFSATPHLNWLTRSLEAQAADTRAIPDFDTLSAHLPRLRALAAAAEGQPSPRCITHRDFHLRNLVIRPKGRIYGLDFENDRPEDPLRDILFFLTDATLTAPDDSDLPAAITAFHAAYGPLPAAPQVAGFLHLYHMLSAWAGLDESSAPLGPNRKARLRVLQRLAATEGTLLG